MHLDTQLFNKLNFPKCFFDRCSILGDLMWDYTTAMLVFLKDMNILIAHSSEECCTTEWSRPRSNQCDGLLIWCWKNFRKWRISHLRDSHLFKYSHCQLLKPVDFDRSLFSMTHIAVTSTELTDRTKLPTCESQRVVWKDNLCSTIPVFVLDVIDEGFDVDCGRTSLLTRCIITFQASVCLSHSLLNGH